MSHAELMQALCDAKLKYRLAIDAEVVARDVFTSATNETCEAWKQVSVARKAIEQATES